MFTPVYNERGTEGRFADRNIHTSFLQRIQPSARNFRAFLPLYPAAIESFDLSGYDLVISSSSAWAHAVICDERAVHVSYCHNPFRYAWNERHRTLAERSNPLSRAALSRLFRRWREWDWIAAQRVDRYVTNSRTTQARIKAYFGRDSQIIYPPVATERFRPQPVGDALPRALRARVAQADRGRDRGLQPPAPAARGDRRRARPAPAAAARRAHGPLRGPGRRRRGGPPARQLPRAGRHDGRGVRDRSRGGAGGGPPGDRPSGGRPARERGGRRDGLPVGGRPRRAGRGGDAVRHAPPSTRARASRTRTASTRRCSARASRARSSRAPRWPVRSPGVLAPHRRGGRRRAGARPGARTASATSSDARASAPAAGGARSDPARRAPWPRREPRR